MAKSTEQTIKVITIDGPSGSGKSTAARKLAERLGFSYLDTGAMYRAVTLKAMRSGINLRDSAQLIELAKNIDLTLVPGPRGVKVFVDGQDVSNDLRTAEVTANVHFVASRRGVRDKMVRRQRTLAHKLGPLVAEGRDQGTVVFPDAQVKFFLDASPSQRARRRYLQMARSGEDISYQQILETMLKRDSRDRNRDTSPLEVPDGAIVIDTTDMSVEGMIDELARHVRRISLNSPAKSSAPVLEQRRLAHDLWYSGWRQLCRVFGSAAFGIRCFGRHNVPASGGAVLACNHQSFLDPMVAGLGLQRQVNYMARDSLFRNFAFGWL
ncbi:MAG: (d)CMP kinase, partial [Actinobacteria bacterium]|nr:(d)CMP kinase [Actinomycetota bacterium]